MGIHFKPSVDPGQAQDPNITYINFSTFPVLSETLRQPIENLYNLQEGCSFPLPANFRLQTTANLAADLKDIAVVAGVASDQETGLPTISGYDAEGEEIGILKGINTPDKPDPDVDWAGVMKTRYRRLDVSDALFESMAKRIFSVSPVLVCQTPDQCRTAYEIIHYFHFHANPSMISEGEEEPIKIEPPLGFAIWTSDRWPLSIFTDNYFPVINHSFLNRIVLTSADSGQSLSPYSILNSRTDEQHPLRIQLDLQFVEIQPAYKSGNNIVRNRSVAPISSVVTEETEIPDDGMI